MLMTSGGVFVYQIPALSLPCAFFTSAVLSHLLLAAEFQVYVWQRGLFQLVLLSSLNNLNQDVCSALRGSFGSVFVNLFIGNNY